MRACGLVAYGPSNCHQTIRNLRVLDTNLHPQLLDSLVFASFHATIHYRWACVYVGQCLSFDSTQLSIKLLRFCQVRHVRVEFSTHADQATLLVLCLILLRPRMLENLLSCSPGSRRSVRRKPPRRGWPRWPRWPRRRRDAGH